MGRIQLTGTFSIMPEGEHVLQIVAVSYKEEFGKLSVTMETADGKKHFENFNLLDSSGQPSTGAYNSFSALARTAMKDNNLEDIDPQDLIGTFVKGTITHREYTDKNGQLKKATQKEPGTWWEAPADEEIEDFLNKSGTPAKKSFDLNSILG